MHADQRNAWKAVVLALTIVGGCLSLSFGDEVPASILDRLSAEDFNAREKAQADLVAWLKDGGEIAVRSALELGTSSEDPEVAERCIGALRVLAMEEYEREGEGYLGIQMQNERFILPKAAEEGGKPDPERAKPGADQNDAQVELQQIRWGVRVTMVVADSAAERAEIKRGDLIVGLNGESWSGNSPSDAFTKKIREFKPRDEVVLTILRDGKQEDFKVSLGRRPEFINRPWLGPQLPDVEKIQKEEKDEFFRQWLERRTVK